MRELLKAVRFLTILPLLGRDLDGPIHPAALPWVGLILGSLLVLLSQVFHFLPELPRAGVLVLLWALLSGGLHLDGLADTVDGVFGGRTPIQALMIMRDSTIGAFGATAIFLVLMLKAFSLATMDFYMAIQGLLFSPALGRWGVEYSLARFPVARREGLAAALKPRAGWGWVSANLALLAGLLLMLWGGWGLVVLAGVWLIAEGTGRYLVSALGGLTGDTYGAVNEVTEVIILLMILAWAGF